MNVLEIRSPIANTSLQRMHLSIPHVITVALHSLVPESPANILKTCMGNLASMVSMLFVVHFVAFVGYGIAANASSMISANVFETRGDTMTCMPFPLSAILLWLFYYCFWGRGALAKARRGKENSLSKKRVPIVKYVLGVNPWLA